MPNNENNNKIEWVSNLLYKTKNQARKVDDGVIGAKGAEERDNLYTELLTHFSENYVASKEQSTKQKTAYFIVTLIFLGILLGSGIAILFIAMFNYSIYNIAVVIGASLDILGTFIAIPTIIAKNLFPEKIDNDVIEVVKLLVENDKNVREAQEKHDNTNTNVNAKNTIND